MFNKFKKSITLKIVSVVIILITIAFLLFSFLMNKMLMPHFSGINNDLINYAVGKNIETIDKLTNTMENKATDIALAGSIFHSIKNNNPEISTENVENTIINYLIDNFKSFPDAIGGGIWYDEGAYDIDKKYYGPYAYWEGNEVVFTWDLNTPEYDYLTQDWFKLALPPNFDRTKKPEKEYYWTPPYIDDAGSEALMITVDAFIYDDNNHIVGISTVDWEIDYMLDILNETQVTENSNSFLIHKDSGVIMSYTNNKDLIMKSTKELTWFNQLDFKNEIVMQSINLDGEEQFVYYAETKSGFYYGVILPRTDIYKVLYSIRNYIMILSLIFIVLISIFILFFLSKILLKPLKSLTTQIASLKNDLSKKVIIKNNDQIGDIAKYFNIFIEKLASIISITKNSVENMYNISNKLANSMNKTDDSSIEINNISDDVKEVIIKQASIISEISASMEEIARTIENQNDKIENQSASVRQSSASIQQMIANIKSIAENLNSSTKEFDNLEKVINKGSNNIKELKKTIIILHKHSDSVIKANRIIENIAEQTNLLAMNASIEASHAGQAGKGFAVVADEIRKLSEVSNQQSKTISENLSNLRKSIDNTKEISDKTELSFEVITKSVNTVINIEKELKTAANELSSGSSEILKALKDISQVTEEVNSGSNEMLISSKEVIKEITRLIDITEKVKDSSNNVVDKSRDVKQNVNESLELLNLNMESTKEVEKQLSVFKIKAHNNDNNHSLKNYK